jgi:hypothetical protein
MADMADMGMADKTMADKTMSLFKRLLLQCDRVMTDRGITRPLQTE